MTVFEGEGGHERLIEALLTQRVVDNDIELATDLAKVGVLVDVPAGHALFHQHDRDTDVFFIVSGAFNESEDGENRGSRAAGEIVGEMSAIKTDHVRCATLTASEASIVLKLTEVQFSEVANWFPSLWRGAAKGIVDRLTTGSL